MAGRNSQGSRGDSNSSPSRTRLVATEEVDTARVRVILLVFAALVAAIGLRLVYLTLVVGQENAAKAEVARTVDVVQTAKRGTIYDRNGVVLACDVEAKTIYCNPREISDASSTAQQLAAILGGTQADYLDALTASDTYFAYIYQKADMDLANRVQELGLDGIYFLDDTKREYPCGSTGGQVVGVCSNEGEGLTGLELYYNDILSGTDGSLVMERGMNGEPIAGSLQENVDPIDGEDIVISIDVDMQEYLEARLVKCAKDIEGDGGNAIVYDAATGEIMAMATVPLVDPSDRSTYADNNMSCTSITTAFEPGSIFKTVSMTAVFEGLDVSPEDTIDCPAALPADEYYVTDAHERGDEVMSLRTILQNSSNVGMSLAARALGFTKLYEKIVEYNLTECTGVDYPGESAGYLTEPDTWSTIQCYNVSFGQGVMVTPLQITRFYGALVNNGVECTPHFLISRSGASEKESYPSEKVIQNTDAIAPVTSMLQSVVSDGTGTDAQIEGFAPAGKTGTAEMVGDDGLYIEGRYNISFTGFLPDTNSELVCFVGVTNVPGDRITTPAFKDIMTFAINHYEITPQ